MTTTTGWTPVRRGRIYCSPACGVGCTWAAHEKARRQAEAVCAELGPGWTAEAHENGHWFAVCVSPDRHWFIYPPSQTHDTCLALLGDARWSGTGETPIAAMKAAWLKYLNAVDEMAQYRTSAPHLVCPVKVPRPAKKTRRKS